MNINQQGANKMKVILNNIEFLGKNDEYTKLKTGNEIFYIKNEDIEIIKEDKKFIIEEAVRKDFEVTKNSKTECPISKIVSEELDGEYCDNVCPILNICESLLKFLKER